MVNNVALLHSSFQEAFMIPHQTLIICENLRNLRIKGFRPRWSLTEKIQHANVVAVLAPLESFLPSNGVKGNDWMLLREGQKGQRLL